MAVSISPSSRQKKVRYTHQICEAPMGKKSAVSVLRIAAVTTLATSLTLAHMPSCVAAQAVHADGSEAKACQLLPPETLEATYGTKLTKPHGFDGESSVCTANIGGLAIKIQSAATGTPGVPTSVSQGLVGARIMLGQAKQSSKDSTRDFGNIGCVSMKMTKGFDGKPLAKRLFTTSCFLVEGGYLNLTIASENSRQVGFDLVKPLLAKAASRR
jgi:hypothetical protein